MKKIISSLLAFGLCLSFSGCSNDTANKKDKSNETTQVHTFYEYDDEATYDYLKKKGYLIDVSDDKNGRFICIHNDEQIWIQKIIAKYVPNPMYTFHNGKVNDEHAEIKNTADNDTDELKKQYKSYLKWLKKMGLKHEQIINLLDYCDNSNSPQEETSSQEETAPQETATLGQKNALQKAKDYLNVMAFSYSGLVKQLEYEGFSNEDAIYGVDHCGANWNEQAAIKAKDYLELMSFSRSKLIDQLKFEGFSQEQAEYGATKAGY